jgi:hypothetical protein
VLAAASGGVEFAGAGGAGVGGGGECDEEMFVGGEELLDEEACGEEFADADAVEEEEAGGGGAVGEEGLAVAEASGPVGAVFAGARAFECDEGCGGECGGGVGGVEEETHGGMIRGEMTNDEAGMTSDVWMRKRAGVGKGKGGMRGGAWIAGGGSARFDVAASSLQYAPGA